jgi:hypothetical protein
VKNPFEYGGVVGGSAFCNRKKELADLVRAMENSEKLFLYSERRLGKTSLIQYALSKLSKRDYASAYVDLWATDGEPSFVTTTARAITESMSRSPEQLLETAKRLFTRLVPSVTVDSDGNPKVTFGISSGKVPDPEIEEVLMAPTKIAAHGKKRVVVVFDEVQRILEYEDDRVERRLRSIIQRQETVSYMFLGSRKHLIQQMFLDKSRPLYRSAGHYPLGPIDTADWLPFIAEKFRTAEKQISRETATEICQLTEGHPFYTQHLCHVLWEQCETGSEVTQESIKRGVKLLLERESYAYSALWESLPLSQRRFLSSLASSPKGVKPFSAEFLQRHHLGSASTAQRAAQGLLQRDLIDRDNGSFLIGDRFFRVWIRQSQNEGLVLPT